MPQANITLDDLAAMMNQGILELKDDIAGVKKDVGSLKNRVNGLENRFSGLENRFSGLENRFSGLENEFKDFKDTVITENDKVMKELIIAREERIAHLGSHDRMQDSLDSHEKRLQRLELSAV
jgi:archaellum component FlaC